MIDSDVSESVVSFILSSHISNNKHDHSIKVYYSINLLVFVIKCKNNQHILIYEKRGMWFWVKIQKKFCWLGLNLVFKPACCSLNQVIQMHIQTHNKTYNPNPPLIAWSFSCAVVFIHSNKTAENSASTSGTACSGMFCE